MNKDYSDSEDEIRAPDDVILERLIDYDNNDYDNDKYTNEYGQGYNHDYVDEIDDKIINESILLAEKNSEDKFQELIQEMNNRNEKYSGIILKFKKLANYDKEVKEIFDLIDWIIEHYINMQIDIYEYDENTYNKIFNVKLLKQIRLNENEIQLLREIIIKNN